MAGVTITITGKNGVSQTFQAIERDATGLAVSVEGAGKRGAAAMEQLGTASTQTAAEITQSSERAEASAQQIGKAIGSAGLAFGAFTLLAGKAAGDSEASAARLSTAFQTANLDIQDYQSQINQLNSTGLHLAFDDEDVQDALARFITQTGDAAKSIKDVQLAEDLARGTNVSLASATATVAAAEAGRTRGLVALVGNLGATATKEDYLAAAQAKYAGSAQAYATTNAAAFERYKNSAENALEAIGGKLEGLQMPILAVSTAATALGPLTGTLKEIANAEKAAEIGGMAMDLALGPVGLAAAALAAGAGIYYLVTQSHDYVSAAETAIGVTDSLTNMLVQLEAASSPQNTLILQALESQITAFIDYAGTAQDRVEGLSTLASRMGQGANALNLFDQTQMQTAEGITHMTEAQLKALDVNQDSVVTYQEMQDALNGVSTAVSGAAGLMQSLTTDQLKHFSDDFANFMALPHLKIPEARQAVSDLIVQFQNGAISADQLLASMDNLLVNTKPYIDVTHEATSAIAAQTAAINTNGQAIAAQMGAYAAVNQSLDQSIRIAQRSTEATVSNGDAIAAQMAAYEAVNGSLDQAIQFNLANTNAIKESTVATLLHQAATQGDASALAQIAQSQGSVAVPASQLTEAVKQQAQAMKDNEAATQAASAAIADYRNRLGEVHMVVNDGANQFAKHATIAGDALDSGFRVAVGNTNAIASQSQGVADWADKLIGVKGTYAEIDKLLAKGTISQDEYNRAQSAETSILHSNAAIQRDIMKIQTDQAPLIAKLTDNEQKYMDALAKKGPQDQLIALGYMDQAESAKALADAQLAASAAAGELGKNGVETATKMIQASAEADPVLAAMLQDMGLISIGANGTITVNFDDVTNGKSDMDKLIDAITILTTDLENIFNIGVNSDDVSTSYQVTHNLNGELDALANRNIHYSVVGDYTTNYIRNDINGTSSGDPSVGGSGSGDIGGGQTSGGGFTDPFGDPTGAYNGGVVGYANGGAVRAMLAEVDPEIVHLAGGGSALARRRGIYDVPRGSYVSTAPATRSLVGMGPSKIELHLHAAGSIVGVDDITDLVIKDLVPALVAASGMHSAGYGV